MAKILIIGDSCRDIFVYCDANRLCPDVPVPVLNVVEQKENPGMAKNVQRNIESFLDCDILTNENWGNITKTRYIHNDTNHMFIRVDTAHNIDRISLGYWPNKSTIIHYDIVVISDYNKGFLTEDDIKRICEWHPLVFLDTKKILGDWAKKAKFIKINNYEYVSSEKHIDSELSNIIIRTKGSEGCFYKGKNYPVKKVKKIKDTSGAGDSFMAGLVVNYYQTRNIEEAISFANDCASKVVSEKGVTIIKNKETI